MAQATYTGEGRGLAVALTDIGGTLMTLSIAMFFVVLLLTIFFGAKGEGPADIPTADTLTGPADSGWELKLDRSWLWFGFAVRLVVVAYGPFLLTYLPPHLTSPGFMF